jgi:D-alanyl-D-alanine carboxypeptidase/D-alanyl-D-alanine-endopeptidase (penicillin-binding protein 4)
VTARRRAGLVLAALVCVLGALATAASARPAAGSPRAALATSTRSADATGDPTGSPTGGTPLWSARRVPALFDALALRATYDRATVELTQRLASIVAPAGAACVAVDGPGGALARIGADHALAPASTLKLVTATATIARLGPGHRFTTRVVTEPTTGDLVVVGGGDPMLATPEYAARVRAQPRFRETPFTDLGALADAVVAAGVHEVRGALVVDDHLHDTRRFLPDWKPAYAQEGDIGALGALTVDGGFDTVTEQPAVDPAVTTGLRLAAMLEARGVHVAGGVRRGVAPAGAREVAHVSSARLADLVGEMLTSSDNYTAEQLLRGLAAAAGDVPATTTAGVVRAERELDALGVPRAGLVMHDGSGLAPTDRVTCATLLRLVELAREPRFAAVDDGLAVAARTGTLAARFTGSPLAGRLRAKTGSIGGVVGLAGVVDRPDALSFAFIANGNFSSGAGEQLQSEVATAIGATPDLRAPRGVVPAP